MARIFGHAWLSRYGETDDGLWESVVSSLGRDEVKKGLRHMLNDWTDSFPPTPGQFRQVARIPMAHRQVPRDMRLTSKPADAEAVQCHIAKMREMFC